jgi:hypothetical protein
VGRGLNEPAAKSAGCMHVMQRPRCYTCVLALASNTAPCTTSVRPSTHLDDEVPPVTQHLHARLPLPV